MFNNNKFTPEAWEAFVRSQDIAEKAHHRFLESEHLLQAMLEQDGLATSILNKAGVDIGKLLARATEFLSKTPNLNVPSIVIYMGHSLDLLLKRADGYRRSVEGEHISIEHLILAYFKDEVFGQRVLREFGLDEPMLRSSIEQVLNASSKSSNQLHLLQQQLLRLLNGDIKACERLIELERTKAPLRPENELYEIIIYQLERDRM